MQMLQNVVNHDHVERFWSKWHFFILRQYEVYACFPREIHDLRAVARALVPVILQVIIS